jgi:hypothetical protein
MRTTSLINALAVLTLMVSAASLTRHAIITQAACPGIAHHTEPHQQRNHQ